MGCKSFSVKDVFYTNHRLICGLILCLCLGVSGNAVAQMSGNYTIDQTEPTFGGLTDATAQATGGAVDLTWVAATEATSPPVTYNIYVNTPDPVTDLARR